MRKRSYTALHHKVYTESDPIKTNQLYRCPVPDCSIPVALVHNVVATTQIFSSVMPIDLQFIADVLPNSVYDRRKFAAITIRMSGPECTALLFTSGKVVLTGCKGWYECILASMRVVSMLRRYMPHVSMHVHDNMIQNVVGHVAIPLQPREILDLDAIYSEKCVQCTYQEKLFPGLIFRPDNSPIVLLCFFSGKIVITGGKCTSDILYGWRKLWPVIKRFVRVAPTGHPALVHASAATKLDQVPSLDELDTITERAKKMARPAAVVKEVEHAGSSAASCMEQ